MRKSPKPTVSFQLPIGVGRFVDYKKEEWQYNRNELLQDIQLVREQASNVLQFALENEEVTGVVYMASCHLHRQNKTYLLRRKLTTLRSDQLELSESQATHWCADRIRDLRESIHGTFDRIVDFLEYNDYERFGTRVRNGAISTLGLHRFGFSEKHTPYMVDVNFLMEAGCDSITFER